MTYNNVDSFFKNIQILGWGWMFLTILRISASNVLKMFLNIILVLGVQLLFSICTNQPDAQIRFIELAATLAGKKEL